jgi:hypothetical protein
MGRAGHPEKERERRGAPSRATTAGATDLIKIGIYGEFGRGIGGVFVQPERTTAIPTVAIPAIAIPAVANCGGGAVGVEEHK